MWASHLKQLAAAFPFRQSELDKALRLINEGRGGPEERGNPPAAGDLRAIALGSSGKRPLSLFAHD